MDYILKAVALPKTVRILDVGCGNGVFTYHLRKAYGFVVGLDFSSRLLGQNPHALRVRGDASRLPFPDSSFDLAFEANLLHHVPDPERVVSSMKRVSHRYVCLIEPNRLNPVMLAFSLAVRAERGVLRSSLGALKSLIKKAKLTCVSAMTTGMISQSNTSQWLVPLLKRFDRIFCGASTWF